MPSSDATAGGRSYPSTLTIPQCIFLLAALVALVSMVWLIPTALIGPVAVISATAVCALVHHWVGLNHTNAEASRADDRGHRDDERGQ